MHLLRCSRLAKCFAFGITSSNILKKFSNLFFRLNTLNIICLVGREINNIKPMERQLVVAVVQYLKSSWPHLRNVLLCQLLCEYLE